MKKLLIVQDNMNMGGIQKALVNFLNENQSRYSITLLLFKRGGVLQSSVPSTVKIVSPNRIFEILGATKDELKKTPLLYMSKAFFVLLTKLFSKKASMRLLSMLQRKIKGYDIAVSYSHSTHSSYFSNGCAEFVVNNVEAEEKVCFIHCDYLNSGTQCSYNDKLYSKFTHIACVSESVKRSFEFAIPEMNGKTIVARNCVNEKQIQELANDSAYVYESSYINLLSVARLSKEKGIGRAINAVKESGRCDLRYYVVGDGPEREALESQVEELGLTDRVFFFGEKDNPYRYMKNADWLFVPSFHEAAPVVFQEARALSLPILTTRTLSADEMVGCKFGIVCDNSEQGIVEELSKLVKR